MGMSKCIVGVVIYLYWDVHCNGDHDAAGEKGLLASEEMAVPDQSSTSIVKGQI